ncbi:MAG: beta-lactamase family protein [Pseudomonadales bacterium]|nr:beta-lactamase family protein [Pseudomonadales bacterium]
MINGYVHPDFADVAKVLQRQLPKKTAGGAAICVYHKGKKVVDIWGGTKNWTGAPWQEDTLAVSFSTTKGVTSTLLHILVNKGLADYDDPVSKYWPEFAQNGKEDITIRTAMSHQAGLYAVTEQLETSSDMLNWDQALKGMEKATPTHQPDSAHGYHGFNYGYLIGGLIEKISGKKFQQVLQEELVDPLKLDGAFIGLPETELHRRANLIGGGQRSDQFYLEGIMKLIEKPLVKLLLKAFSLFTSKPNNFIRTFIFPFTEDKFCWNSPELSSAVQPAANGHFTARSLAKMYAALSLEGSLDGVEILTPETVYKMSRVQNRKRDDVLFIPMHWRLGYHRVFAFGAPLKNAFGHFGFGGSGAWCDPERELSCAMTVNTGVGTPMGDTRMPILTSAVVKCVNRIEKYATDAPVFGAGELSVERGGA